MNSTTDAVDGNPGDGVCETAAGNRVCTLRAAVMETNNIIGPNTINLPAGTYTLTIPGPGEDAAATGDLDIANFLTIVGGGRDVTVVDAGGLDRIFQVLNVNVNLSNLTLKGGNAGGDNGGAILAGQYGIVALDQVTLADNRSAGGSGGGALLTPGATIKLVGVDIVRNRSSSNGGGIYIGGPLSMSGGIIKDNIADGNGGGVASFADTNLSDVVIQGNWARGGAGGGIYNVQALSLTGAIVEGNAASGGGGLYNQGSATVSATAILENTTTAGGGGVYTLSGASFTNVTISGNQAAQYGGGIVFEPPLYYTTSYVFRNVTIAENTAPFAGGLRYYRHPFATALLSLKDCIVANNTIGANCSHSESISDGHNLDSDGSCGFTAAGDLSNVDPRLGDLGDNGGFSPTHALLSGSRAIDAGDNVGCPSTDQRGAPRPVDGNGDGVAVCDIGAYEAGGVVPVPSGSPTPTRTPQPSGSKPFRLAYYSLGDSIASGHGLTGGTGRNPTISLPGGGVLHTCQRSPNAYPGAVATKLKVIPGFRDKVDFHHLACTGAQTAHTLRDPGLTDLPDQLRQFQTEISNAAPQFTLVSLTVGADDFDFTTELLHGIHLCKPKNEFDAWVKDTSSAVQDHVATRLREILRANPKVSVVLTDYPNPFTTDSAYFPLLIAIARAADPFNKFPFWGRLVDGLYTDLSCIVGVNSETLANRAQWAVSRLNRALADAAHDVRNDPRWANRVRFVTINRAFKSHEGPPPNCGGGAVAPDQTYVQFPDFPISFLNLALHPNDKDQLVQKIGSDCIHPNEEGAQVYANGSGSVGGVFDAALELLSLNVPVTIQPRRLMPEFAGLTTPTEGDCCTAHDGAGCAMDACQACVCAPDSTCCDTGWNTYCVEDAKTVCAEACQCALSGLPTSTPTITPTPGGDCATAHLGHGCDTPQCQACVCVADPDCCTTTWDDICVADALGTCALSCVSGYSTPTPTANPTPGGDCCATHAGPGCDVGGCQSCVCGIDDNCCDNGWDQFCLNIVADTCAADCACAPTPTPTPPPTGILTPTSTGSPPTATSTSAPIPTPGGDCCSAHGGPGCDLASCQSCICGADSFCCEILWDDRCVPKAADTCSSSCRCVPTPTVTATQSEPVTGTPTPSPPPTIPCPGDCGGTRTVAVNDIITLVNIALGNADASACSHGIPTASTVDVSLIVRAVNNALTSCPVS